MALRVVLVGLVASLGFEWPTGAELTRLVDSGRVWVTTQWQDLKDSVAGSDVPVADTLALERPEPMAPTILVTNGPLGAAFTVGPTVAVGSILSEEGIFRSEARAPLFAALTPTPGDAATIEVVEEFAPEATLPVLTATEPADLGFEAVVGEMASAFSADVSEPTLKDEVAARNLDPEGLDDRPTAPATEAPGERFGTAVRLTGQAVQAWMSVLHQRTPSSIDRP